jgi:hypothetical protein
MKNSAIIFIMLLLNAPLLCAQNPTPARPSDDYSGMYAFLQDGEFVQLTIEDQGVATGLISHYTEPPKREFVDQFFDQGKLDGNKLTFTTKHIQDVWYAFEGTVERGAGQNIGDEGYYVLKGKLTRSAIGADKKATSKSQEVSLKSFPKDLGSAPAK